MNFTDDIQRSYVCMIEIEEQFVVPNAVPCIRDLVDEDRESICLTESLPYLVEQSTHLRSRWVIPSTPYGDKIWLECGLFAENLDTQVSRMEAVEIMLEKIVPNNFVPTPNYISKAFHWII